jgi:long-chain fatty acid transport protein
VLNQNQAPSDLAIADLNADKDTTSITGISKDNIMHASYTRLTSALILLGAGLSLQAHAQGFALNEQNIASLGAAHAGRAALANDASVIYTNPAALTQLKQRQVTTNATFIKAYTDIDNVAGTPNSPPATNDGDMVPNVEIGSAFLALPMQSSVEGLSVGVGFYAPYGLATNYEDTFQGRAFGDKSKVKIMAIQPTMGYELSPTLSIGAGISINRAEGELTAGLAAVPTTVLGYSKLTGDDIGVGYNLGALFKATPTLTVGLNYKSKVDYTLDGTSEVRGVPVPASAQVPFMTSVSGSSKATLDITTPDSIELALTYQLQSDITLLAGITHTRWDSLQTLAPQSSFTASDLTVSGIPSALPAAQQQAIATGVATAVAANINASKGEALNFKNANMYSIGMAYQYQPNLVLRVGVGVDETPVKTEYRNVRLPTEDRTMFSIGAGYTLSDNATLDVGYMYFYEDAAEISRSDASKGSYSAVFNNNAHILGAQLNYKF